MYKIVLDAGHGGADPGATFQGRQEKDDNLRLALAVGRILQNQGVDVIYTRADDTYQTPFEKATVGNENDADFFISFHRNSSEEPEQYSGIETLVYNDSGLKYEMAENINQAVANLGYRNLGVKERPGLVVLRRTKMPALLIETGFINTIADNQLFDEKFEEIAQAIAGAILKTLDMAKDTSEDNSEDLENQVLQDDGQERLYRVQVGAFRNRTNAEQLLYELEDKGYPAFMMEENGLYKVQVGAYRMLSNAVKMESQLRREGYNTFITL